MSIEIGWFESEKDGIKKLKRITKETHVELTFDTKSLKLTIEATGDLEHHVREDVAIVAKRFAPHSV